MSDPALTRDLSIKYCPACQPERDPTHEILVTRWCSAHEPGQIGEEDDRVHIACVDAGTSTGEAHGRSCAAIQRLIR